jgi:putative SOS response-associated peptidase YedK
MCGRYTLRRFELLRAAFDATLPLFEEFSETRRNPLDPRFNIAPSQLVPVVRPDAGGQRVVSLVQWGLIPHWAKDKPKAQPINARAETVGTSGMFRQAFDRRRCLIPADGFYEWKRQPDGTKQPMFIHRTDHAPFAFGGLWERWRPAPDAPAVDTCTIITTAANELMQDIHDRMPLIVAEADYARWLDRNTPGQAVADVLHPASSQGWSADPVDRRVNSPRNDDPDLIAPIQNSA